MSGCSRTTVVAGAAAQRMTSRLVAAAEEAGCFLAFLKFTAPMSVATVKAAQHAVHHGIGNAVWGRGDIWS